jgi:hypothetical protein
MLLGIGVLLGDEARLVRGVDDPGAEVGVGRVPFGQVAGRATASCARSQSARARALPTIRSSQSWSCRWPVPTCPPLRPEAPKPSRCASSRITS